MARIINQEDTLFYFERRGGEQGKGLGIPTSEGFVILKGAYVAPNLLESARQWEKSLRDKHKEKIKDNYTTEDMIFLV